MTVGISTVLANSMLELAGDPFIQMHIGDPGRTGTANVATFSQRVQIDLGAASDGARSLVGAADWPSPWTGVAQTVTHLTGWDAATGGNFLFSVGLVSQAEFSEAMIPRLTLLSVSVPSLASD
jgi:hypothetical protein